jgi:hypothetical protein
MIPSFRRDIQLSPFLNRKPTGHDGEVKPDTHKTESLPDRKVKDG